MRGIVELEVLRAIQNQIGNRVPVQAFFDLIVGTSTGGIIALAFGVKNWSIRRCADRFRKLCGAAFTPRLMQAIPILKYVITLKLASRYQTTPLRKALKSTLGEQPLFGNNGRRRSNHSAKIAVTATDQAGTRPIIIANYSRKDCNSVQQRPGEYEFLRPDGPDHELAVWEAAAATSAAPSYFKPFEHAPTKRTYLDGAIYHNNPVRLVHRERKLLWPDVADRDPDILLSIGTSQNSAILRRSLSSEAPSDRTYNGSKATEHARGTRSRKRTFPRMRQMFATMHNRIDSILDAELAWKEFCKDVANADESMNEASRYIRINPDIGYNPPGLDDVRMFGRLQRDVRRELRSADGRAQTARVALMLVASSFYYERTGHVQSEADGTFTCTGQIYCKFEDGSPYLRGLGDFFMNQQTSNFRPYFQVGHDSGGLQNVAVSLDVSRMKEMASFRIDTPVIRTQKKDELVTITLHLRSPDLPPAKYHISGFPRVVMEEPQVKSPKKEASGTVVTDLTWPDGELPTSSNVPELEGTLARPLTSGRAVSESLVLSMSHVREPGGTDRHRRSSTGALSSNHRRNGSQPTEEQSNDLNPARPNQIYAREYVRSSRPEIAPPAELAGDVQPSTREIPPQSRKVPMLLRGPIQSSAPRTVRESSPHRTRRSHGTTEHDTVASPRDHVSSATSSANSSAPPRQSLSRVPPARNAEDPIRVNVVSRLEALDREIENGLERRRGYHTISRGTPASSYGTVTALRQPPFKTSTEPSLQDRRAAPASTPSINVKRNDERDHHPPPVSRVPRILPQSDAAPRRQRLTPSPLAHLRNAPSLDQRLRSMPSGISMFSDDQTVDTSSTLSITPDQYGSERRLRRGQGLQVRRILSTTFSDVDDDQSEFSEMSNLGRRRWEDSELG